MKRWVTSTQTRIVAIGNHADLLRELGEYDESQQLFEVCLRLIRAHLPTRHYVLGICLTKYSELLWAQERLQEAERNLIMGYEILVEQVGSENRHTVAALERLVELLEATGKLDKAEQHRKLVLQNSANH